MGSRILEFFHSLNEETRNKIKIIIELCHTYKSDKINHLLDDVIKTLQQKVNELNKK